MSTLAHELSHTARLRRQVARREKLLYGRLLADVRLLRQRGFAVHVELKGGARRYRVGNRLVGARALSAMAARERRLMCPQPDLPLHREF